MAGIAECKAARRSEKCANQRRGEHALLAKIDKLLIHRPDEASLFDIVHIASHQVAQSNRYLRHERAVSADIGQQHARDTPRGTRRKIVDIAPARSLVVRPAVDPNLQSRRSGSFDRRRDYLPTLPCIPCVLVRFGSLVGKALVVKLCDRGIDIRRSSHVAPDFKFQFPRTSTSCSFSAANKWLQRSCVVSSSPSVARIIFARLRNAQYPRRNLPPWLTEREVTTVLPLHFDVLLSGLPVASSQLPGLNRLQDAKNFLDTTARVQIVNADPLNHPLGIDQECGPQANVLRRIENPQIGGQLLSRDQRIGQIIQSRVRLPPGQM